VASGDEPLEERTITVRRSALGAPRPAAGDLVDFLMLTPDGAPPQRFPLLQPTVVIGRTAPAAIVLEGGTVSRRHCELTRQGGQVVIADVGSTNGTYVNGVRIEAPVTLNDGDTIGVGAHSLRYHRRGTDEMAAAESIQRELDAAAGYVRAVLPEPLTSGPVLADWMYVPSERLGGDILGYQMLDPGTFAAFLLDVAGHGAAAALHAVTVANVLRQRLLPGVDPHDPAAVLRGLNRMFPMERHSELFFTIWYGVYDISARMLSFATGGHHPGYLVPPPPHHPIWVGTRNPSIGIAPDRDVAAERIAIPQDSVLHLFSDGVFEVIDQQGRQWGLHDLPALLPNTPESHDPRRLYETVRAAARPGPLEDDYSALVLRFV
jgi:hypothetical protein